MDMDTAMVAYHIVVADKFSIRFKGSTNKMIRKVLAHEVCLLKCAWRFLEIFNKKNSKFHKFFEALNQKWNERKQYARKSPGIRFNIYCFSMRLY